MEQLLALIWIVVKILMVLIPLIVVMLFVVLAERKVVGYIQSRIGPNRVGPFGLAQPLADMVKFLFKEVIVPKSSTKYLYLIAPILSLVPAMTAWTIIPFGKGLAISNVNAGVLFIFAMTSLGVYGVLTAGWASNSKYAIYGALRSAAQVISYEIALGFALVGVLLAAGTLNLQQIVLHQAGGIWHWYFLPLFPLAVIFWIASVAETNRAPFDVAEGESELVAGFHVEYSGLTFALFFLAEYISMILVAVLTTLFFFWWLVIAVCTYSCFGSIICVGARYCMVRFEIFFLYIHVFLDACDLPKVPL